MVGGCSDATVAEPHVSGQVGAGEAHEPVDTGSELARELAAIQSAIPHNMRELSVLINDGKDRRMARAAGELGAAVESMETATQKMSAEVVDDCARALASALSDGYHRGLAQDVQDHVVRIYEACNFQDLAGQRIGKVIATLVMVEERIVAMIQRHSGTSGQPAQASKPPSSTELINGPRLDGAAGHASQIDIDAMFA